VRCYFMRGGHIRAVEEMPGLSDEEAVAKGHQMLVERRTMFEGFEVWDRSRMVIQYPPIEEEEQRPAPVGQRSAGLNEA
jgi:hypothetical protein